MVAKKTAVKKTATRKKAASGPAAAGPAAQAENAAPQQAAVVEEGAGQKTAGRKATAQRATVRKATAKKAATKTEPAGKSAGRKAAPEIASAKTAVTRKSALKTAVSRKSATDVTGAGKPESAAGGLAVRPGEEPWTSEEVAEARAGLLGEKNRLSAEIHASGEAITGLMRDSGDGAGDDQADTGSKNITREHELSLAANAREMLEQTEHALERIDTGTYGRCESCGRPIGKGRMQAFPRATLCVECKQRQERR